MAEECCCKHLSLQEKKKIIADAKAAEEASVEAINASQPPMRYRLEEYLLAEKNYDYQSRLTGSTI